MIYRGKYAASNFIVQRGIELDYDKGCYQLTYRIFNLFAFKSACEKLPKGEYLLLFRTLYAKCETCTIEDFDESSTIQLSLVYRKNRRLILHESHAMSDMRLLAKDMSQTMKLKIRDSATNRRKPVWLS